MGDLETLLNPGTEMQNTAFTSDLGNLSTHAMRESGRSRKEEQSRADPLPPSDLDPINPLTVRVSTRTMRGEWIQTTASPSFSLGPSVILYELLTKLELPLFPARDGFPMNSSIRSTKWTSTGIAEITLCTCEKKVMTIACLVVRRKSKAPKKGEIFLSQKDARMILHAKDDGRKVQDTRVTSQELQHDALSMSSTDLLSYPNSTTTQHAWLPDRPSQSRSFSLYSPTTMTGQYDSQLDRVCPQNAYLSPYDGTPSLNQLQSSLIHGLGQDHRHRSYQVGPATGTHGHNMMFAGNEARLFPRPASLGAVSTTYEPLADQDGSTYYGTSLFRTIGSSVEPRWPSHYP